MYLPIDPNSFKTTHQNKSIGLYKLTNASGLVCEVTNYGGILVSLWTPDFQGNYHDIVLGFDNIQDYIFNNDPYFGATIGRFANRIKNASFTIYNKTYQLKANDGQNHLHGGALGFDKVVWDVIFYNDSSIEMVYFSKNGEEGYPGNLTIKLTYQLANDDKLSIRYEATSDQSTPINVTNHSYFNLNGNGNGLVTNHQLQINAVRYTPVDQNLIPTGKIAKLTEALDFRTFKTIGKHINSPVPEIKVAGGYDHNFVLNNDETALKYAATVIGDIGNRRMKVHTTEPGLQLYTSNWKGDYFTGKQGIDYRAHSGFCLETQHFPDSPNKDSFPSTLLHPGQKFESITQYQFDCKA